MIALNKITLSRELIENLISNKYINAQDFKWEDNSIAFVYEEVKDEEYLESNVALNGVIYGLQNTLSRLEGRLAQAEIDQKNIVREFIRG